MALSNNPRPEWDRLLMACQQNNVTLVQQLLSPEESGGGGVSANHGNIAGQTALHIASWWSHPDCVALLLNHKANVEATNKLTNATPLHCACQSNRAIGTPTRLQTIKLLLENGSDPDALDQRGRRPIDYFETTDPNLSEIQQLFASTTVIAAEKYYYRCPKEEQPVFQAIQQRSLELLQKSLSILASTLSALPALQIQPDQQSPLQLLVTEWCETTDQADPFFASALNVFLADDSNKINYRQDASNNDNASSTAKVKKCYLEENGPVGSCVDELCSSILERYKQYKSTSNSDPLIVEWITAVSTLLSSLQSSSSTPITTTTKAATLLWLDIARRNYLDLAGVWWNDFQMDPSTVIGRQGMTPLHFAARSGHLEMAKFLLNTCSATTTTTTATSGGCSMIMMMDRKNDLGQTPMQAALVNQHDAVVDFLQGLV